MNWQRASNDGAWVVCEIPKPRSVQGPHVYPDVAFAIIPRNGKTPDAYMRIDDGISPVPISPIRFVFARDSIVYVVDTTDGFIPKILRDTGKPIHKLESPGWNEVWVAHHADHTYTDFRGQTGQTDGNWPGINGLGGVYVCADGEQCPRYGSSGFVVCFNQRGKAPVARPETVWGANRECHWGVPLTLPTYGAALLRLENERLVLQIGGTNMGWVWPGRFYPHPEAVYIEGTSYVALFADGYASVLDLSKSLPQALDAEPVTPEPPKPPTPTPDPPKPPAPTPDPPKPTPTPTAVVDYAEWRNLEDRLEDTYRHHGQHPARSLVTHVNEGGEHWRRVYFEMRRTRDHESTMRHIESTIDGIEGRPDRWGAAQPPPVVVPPPTSDGWLPSKAEVRKLRAAIALDQQFFSPFCLSFPDTLWREFITRTKAAGLTHVYVMLSGEYRGRFSWFSLWDDVPKVRQRLRELLDHRLIPILWAANGESFRARTLNADALDVVRRSLARPTYDYVYRDNQRIAVAQGVPLNALLTTAAGFNATIRNRGANLAEMRGLSATLEETWQRTLPQIADLIPAAVPAPEMNDIWTPQQQHDRTLLLRTLLPAADLWIHFTRGRCHGDHNRGTGPDGQPPDAWRPTPDENNPGKKKAGVIGYWDATPADGCVYNVPYAHLEDEAKFRDDLGDVAVRLDGRVEVPGKRAPYPGRGRLVFYGEGPAEWVLNGSWRYSDGQHLRDWANSQPWLGGSGD